MNLHFFCDAIFVLDRLEGVALRVHRAHIRTVSPSCTPSLCRAITVNVWRARPLQVPRFSLFPRASGPLPSVSPFNLPPTFNVHTTSVHCAPTLITASVLRTLRISWPSGRVSVTSRWGAHLLSSRCNGKLFNRARIRERERGVNKAAAIQAPLQCWLDGPHIVLAHGECTSRPWVHEWRSRRSSTCHWLPKRASWYRGARAAGCETRRLDQCCYLSLSRVSFSSALRFRKCCALERNNDM